MAAGYKPGDLILKSLPYAYVLDGKQRGKRCDWCFDDDKSLKRCSQCSFAYFCGQECQKNGWADHKEECLALKREQLKEPVPSLRLLMRIILKIKKYGYQYPWEMVGDCRRSIGDLESHKDDIKCDPRRNEAMLYYCAALKEVIGEENFPSAEEFYDIFGKMVVNTFSICDSNSQSIGCGLYVGSSIFDHSCDPDAEVVFNGLEMTVHAVRNIRHRDYTKIYISYIEQMQFSEDRQKQLLQQYYFTCQCRRCLDPQSDELMRKVLVSHEKAIETEKHSKKVVEKIREMRKNNVSEVSIYEMAMDDLAAQEGILDSTHLYRVKMTEFVFESCILLSRWDEALASGQELIDPFKTFYGKYNPYYCVLLAKVAKLMLLCWKDEDAEKLLIEAKESICISHGSSHLLYKKVEEMLLQCQQAITSSLS